MFRRDEMPLGYFTKSEINYLDKFVEYFSNMEPNGDYSSTFFRSFIKRKTPKNEDKWNGARLKKYNFHIKKCQSIWFVLYNEHYTYKFMGFEELKDYLDSNDI